MTTYVHTDGRTLGSELRGARLGFHWLSGAGRYVRIRPNHRNWIVDAVLPEMLPSRPGPRHEDECVAWWTVPEIVELLDTIVTIQVRTSFISKTWVMDDEGQVVE